MERNAAQAVVECLVYEGVDVVFGYPGGAILPVYDALRDSGIRHILTRHEQAAAHAADGYARATGKVGVCIGTSGPGAVNLVTGIATAYMDSSPLVAITGQVPLNMIGTDSFQEIDITGATMCMTKHNYLVKSAADVPRIVKEAFHIASTGRPGPVLIDLPLDVLLAPVRVPYPERVDLPGYRPTTEGHPLQIAKAVKMIGHAKRPVLYAGGGVIIAGACEELRAVAELGRIPVTTTMMGLGAFPTEHPLSLGMLGLHGTYVANYAVQEADLLIAVGARFDNRVTGDVERFAPNARIIHIDIDPAEIGKIVRVDLPIVGDARSVLSAMLAQMSPGKTTEWHHRVNAWQKEYALRYEQGTDAVKPQFVVEQINAVTGGDAIVLTEVGQHQMWAAQFGRFSRPRTFLSSGGLGTMGFGLPAALGAQVGCPDRLVVLIAGDGSFQMNLAELATIAEHRLPVKMVILNNGGLGMVRQLQDVYYRKRHYEINMPGSPDFVKLAQAYGGRGLRVTRPEKVRRALEDLFSCDSFAVLDVRIDPAENVFPMVLSGRALNEMTGGIS